MQELPRLQFGHGLGTDHAAVGDHPSSGGGGTPTSRRRRRPSLARNCLR
jgi:hypothetical protein